LTAGEQECHVAMTADSSTHTPVLELYDSGASRHMSPYRHRFENYREIPLRAIIATDERTFYRVRIGDLRIKVPCGESHSIVLLQMYSIHPIWAWGHDYSLHWSYHEGQMQGLI
jgi:hypothetical protein